MLLPQPSGKALGAAYRWLHIALAGVAPEDEDHNLVSVSIQIAIKFATERMTADQVAVAERLAAEREPGPSKCEMVPEPMRR